MSLMNESPIAQVPRQSSLMYSLALAGLVAFTLSACGGSDEKESKAQQQARIDKHAAHSNTAMNNILTGKLDK